MAILFSLPAFAEPDPGAKAKEMKAVMKNVSGSVEVMKRGSTAWVQAQNGMQVGTGDQISTGIDGSAALAFENGVTDVKPLTQFVVGRAMQTEDVYMTEIFLQVGKLVNDVDKESGKANKFTVTTPTAVAGIRGTQQEISFGEGFGTQCKIEDGAGYVAPVDVDKLPPAVQMALGVGAAAQEAAAKVQEAAQQQAGGGGGAEPGAAVQEAATQVQEKVAEALDQWLSASFDAVVEGPAGGDEAAPEGGAEGGEGEAGAEGGGEQPREEEATAAEMEQMLGDMLGDEGAYDVESEMVIEDGMEGGVIDATDFEAIVDPESRILEDAITDISAAGTSDAEAEALLITTEFSDETASEAAIESAEDPSLLIDLINATAEDLDVTVEDLFGTPPDHP